MKRGVEVAIATARERSVPWDGARAQRVFADIGAARARSRWSSIGARLAVGSLASAALFLCVARLSSAIHSGTPPAPRFAAASSQSTAHDAEAVVFEPATGDGGYEAQQQRR